MSRWRNTLCALWACISLAQFAPAQQKPRLVTKADTVQPMAATMGSVTATPGTISFTATDPDLGSVSGSSGATVNWTTTGGSTSSTWNLKVHSSAAHFANCATVPASAVTVSCNTVTGGSAGTCSAPFALSTTGTQVASGKESSGTGAAYSVTLTFTLADSWKYIAKQSPSCTLTLTYTVTAP
ncbi:MAG TPA: hypothetical protein VLY04_19535 [Bryobacteraceae bacterium]|nr:hypothetical protein [Bryobacteraceae bacterium]